ncbi:MAG: GreA/GreB family elongation factor [Myxococcota bacterium]|nr:GreA/GreB family elongation factor [Myxococcota bacterium]
MKRPAKAAPKAALKTALLAELEGALAAARSAHQAAVEGATHDDARPENDKDTRGLEQSYLARGIAQRVAELEAAIGSVTAMTVRAFDAAEPISIGAVVDVDEDGRARRFLIAAGGGGVSLAGDVTVLTPTSPIGRALVGKRTGDDCEFVLGGGPRTLTVTRIA